MAQCICAPIQEGNKLKQSNRGTSFFVSGTGVPDRSSIFLPSQKKLIYITNLTIVRSPRECHLQLFASIPFYLMSFSIPLCPLPISISEPDSDFLLSLHGMMRLRPGEPGRERDREASEGDYPSQLHRFPLPYIVFAPRNSTRDWMVDPACRRLPH